MRRLVGVLKLVGLALTVSSVAVAGGVAAGVLGVPSAGLVDRGDWGTVTDDRIEVETTYWVDNPNPVGLSSNGTEIDYELALNDVVLANGTKRGVAVPRGNATGNVTTTIDQGAIPAWFRSHVRDGERSAVAVGLDASVPVAGQTFRASAPTITRNVSTNVTGSMAASLARYEGNHPAGVPVVEVRDTEVTWGEVTESETPIRATFVVHNPNPTVLPVPAFAGELSGNGVKLADWNASEVQVTEAPDDGTIGPGETERITFEAEMRNERLDEWFTSHVREGERTNLTITGALAFSHEGATYTIPRDGGVRCHAYFQTGIFVDGQSSDPAFQECEPAPPGVAEDAREGARSFADGSGWSDGSGGSDGDGSGDDGSGGDGGLLGGGSGDGTTTPTASGGATSSDGTTASEGTATPTDPGGTATDGTLLQVGADD